MNNDCGGPVLLQYPPKGIRKADLTQYLLDLIATWINKSNKAIPIKMWGRNDGHASLKYILVSIIIESTSTPKITTVIIQFKKIFLLTEMIVDSNKANTPINTGKKIQSTASIFT